MNGVWVVSPSPLWGEGWGEGLAACAFPEACFLQASSAGISPRRATYFLLLRQKKVSKEKATPLPVSLRFAPGNLRCSRLQWCCGTRFALARSAQTAAASQMTMLGHVPLPKPTAVTALLGTGRGGPDAAHASGGGMCVSTAVFLPLPLGEGWGEGSRLPTPLAAPAARCLRGGGCTEGCRRFVNMPAAFVRAERAAQSELCGAPRKPRDAGLPRSEAQGSQTRGSPSFAYFSWRSKKSESPAGARPGQQRLQATRAVQCTSRKPLTPALSPKGRGSNTPGAIT